MSNIREFLIAAMTAAVAFGIIKLISPEMEGIKKQMKLALSLSVCAVIVFSLADLVYGNKLKLDISDLSDDTQNNTAISMAGDEIADSAAEIICREMEGRLKEKYKVDSLTVRLQLDKSDLSSVKIISAALSGEDATQAMTDYIEEILGCESYIEE